MPPELGAATSILSIKPNSGHTSGGTQVVIRVQYEYGESFCFYDIYFGTIPVYYTGYTPYREAYYRYLDISVTTPPHDSGYVDVIVKNYCGNQGYRANGFRYGSAVQEMTDIKVTAPTKVSKSANFYVSSSQEEANAMVSLSVYSASGEKIKNIELKASGGKIPIY